MKVSTEHQKPLKISCLFHSQDQGGHFVKSSKEPKRRKKKGKLGELIQSNSEKPPGCRPTYISKNLRKLLSLVDTWKMGHGHEQVPELLFQKTRCLLCL